MSPIRYMSLPSLRRCLDQSDYDSLDVPLFSNRPLTQLLRKLATEFKIEEKPNVTGDKGWLRSAGHGDPCGSFGRQRTRAAFRSRRKGQLGLIVTNSGAESAEAPTSATGGSVRKVRVFVSGMIGCR